MDGVEENPSTDAQALNTKAASKTAMESSGIDEAGPSSTKKPGRPKKELTSSQKQKIHDFFQSKPKAEKRSRREKDVDSSDEDMDDGDCKAVKLSKSPTQQEMEIYKKVATQLHKEGTLKPAIAKRCIEEHNNMLHTLEKEGEYYSKMKKRIKAGKKTPTKQQFALDCEIFKAKKFQSKNRITDLLKLNRELSDTYGTETKAITYESPNASIDDTFGLGSLEEAYQDVLATEDED